MPPEETNTDPVSTEVDDAEFDKAFAEAASVHSGSPAPDADDLDDDADPAPAPQPEAEPAPAAAPAPAAGTVEAAGDPSPAQEPASDDIWANAPPELRAAHEAAMRDSAEKVTRLKGQVSASDRQLYQLRQRQAPPANQPAATDVAALLKSDRIKQFREEYGEISEPVIELVEGLLGEVLTVKGSVSNIDDQRAQDFVDSQLSIYEKDHPDWREYATHAGWNDWIAGQPRHIQEAAQRNAEFIVDASEASDVLTRFKASIAPPAQQEPQPAPAPQPQPQPDARRESQLKGAQAVDAKGPAAGSGDPDNFDVAFDRAAAKLDRRNSGRTNTR